MVKLSYAAIGRMVAVVPNNSVYNNNNSNNNNKEKKQRNKETETTPSDRVALSVLFLPNTLDYEPKSKVERSPVLQ